MPKQFPMEFRQRALRLLAEARQQEQYQTEGQRSRPSRRGWG